MFNTNYTRDQVNGVLIELDDQSSPHEVNGYTRQVEFNDSYDLRDSKGGLDSSLVRMLVMKDKCAVQFLWRTGQYNSEIEAALPKDRDQAFVFQPMGYDVGYHSPVPMWKGQEPFSEDCPYIGCACYYDGSSLQAVKMLQLLLEEGVEAVWARLEDRWAKEFGLNESGGVTNGENDTTVT